MVRVDAKGHCSKRGGKKERISESLQRVYISVPSIKENEKRSDEEPPKDKEIEKE
jgi:hypothetical protein